MKGVNWLGLVLALVAGQAIGFVWYGMVFEERWMALSGVTAPEAGEANMAMAWGVVASLVVVVGLALAIPRLGKETLAGGALIGLAAFVFFALPTAALDMIYADDPAELLTLDAGYLLAFYVVAGALIGGVRLRRSTAAAA